MNTRLRRLAGATLLALGTAISATAQAQVSHLNLVGSLDLYRRSSILTFDVLGAGSGASSGTVTACCSAVDQIGLFAGSNGSSGTHADLTFGAGTLPPAVLLSIAGYSFVPTTFQSGSTGTPLTLTYDGTSTFASLTARGTVTGPGAAAGQFMFVAAYSSQFPGITPELLLARIDSDEVLTKSFSATFTVSPVPEPSSLALMAAGLGFAAALARRRRNANRG